VKGGQLMVRTPSKSKSAWEPEKKKNKKQTFLLFEKKKKKIGVRDTNLWL
jgi:uncharacterized membrane protein